MHATSTLTSTAPQTPLAPPRSLSRAVADLRAGVAHRELWAHLGWQDIKQRYRRSVLGPFWITISQGVIALGLGLLYGVLFQSPFVTFLPYVSTGMIVWAFIQGSLIEGMDTFIANEGLLKHLPAPLSVYALRTVWRQILQFAHNFGVYLVILVIFFRYLDRPYSLTAKGGSCALAAPGALCNPGLSATILLAIPGFLLVAINAGWVAMLLGIVSTRFRDFPQFINSLTQLMFYLTPIIWPVDSLTGAGGANAALARIARPLLNLNPIYHLVQVVRGPLIGEQVSKYSWIAVVAMAIVGWAVALLVMRNYRARVSYWV
ncbi:MAG: galactan export ABC transporter permease subunit Wzm/RfbD [Sciscionella sp.]